MLHLRTLLLSGLLLCFGSFALNVEAQEAAWTPPGSVAQLPPSDGLPDVLQLADGTRVTDAASWHRRRAEIKAMMLHYQYGTIPPRPDVVTARVDKVQMHESGLGTENWITLSIHSRHQLAMRAVLYLPNKPGPYPVVIREEGSLGRTREVPMFLKRGYMFIEYARHDLDPDRNNVVGPAQQAYPDHDWQTLAVWAWGGMRLIDYLESRDDVDMNRIAITGHSRGGKMALLAGALDERISLVVPNGSGAGGAGSYRVLGPGAEALSMNDKPHWYSPRILDFVDRIDRLPFDQHFLKALVAPRALLCTESVDDEFANPEGTQATSMAAREVYRFLNADVTKVGLRYRRGKHDSSTEDWQALLDFAEWHWFDRQPADVRSFWMTPYDLPAEISGVNSREISREEGLLPDFMSTAVPDEDEAAEAATGKFVTIRAAGNAADENFYGRGAYGAVADEYEIATRKVTNAEYAAFLNAVARKTDVGLFNVRMTGIRRVESDGAVHYEVEDELADAAVMFVDWYDALRYCNWLHNGRPDGEPHASTTESGAYEFSGRASVGPRTSDARYFLPSEDEWYKAAYFDAATNRYHLFARQADGNLTAKYRNVLWQGPLVDVAKGWEWNEANVSNLFRGLRSGAWFLGNNRQSAGRFYSNPQLELRNIGFRVARSVTQE